MSTNKVRIHRPKLTDYQRAFLYNAERFTVTEAATKVGKTLSHSWWLFEKAHTPPNEGDEYLWLAPTYAQAEMVFSDVVRKVAPTGAYTINRSDLTITTPGTGVLRYKTAEKPDNLYGPSNIQAIVGDEFTRWRPSVWPVVRSLATARSCPVKLIGNYIGEDNWGHRLAMANANDPEWAYHKITAFDAVKAGIMKEEEVESARRSLPPSVFAALYLCEGTADPDMMIAYSKINDLFTNEHVLAEGEMSMIVDVAGEGRDKTVASVWHGYRVIDWWVQDISHGPQLVASLNYLAQLHKVPRSRIVVDADGIGGMGVADSLPGCVRFHAQAKAVEVDGHFMNFANIKAQCSYLLAQMVNGNELCIEPGDHRDTVVQDLSWVRRAKINHDVKLRILPKEKVKEGLGRSPDFADNMMMRMVLELRSTFATFERSIDLAAERERDDRSGRFKDHLADGFGLTPWEAP